MKLPKYCKAPFECKFQIKTRHNANGKNRVHYRLPVPIKICGFTESCNQRTDILSEAKTELEYPELLTNSTQKQEEEKK